MASAHRHRLSSRVLLFDAADRVLLFLTKAPDTSGSARWLTPGGGVDEGESHAQAAVRELFEETGLVVESAGDPVWAHDFDVEWDDADHDTGHAEFYLVRARRFEPARDHWTPEEHVDVLAHRWWSLDELAATDEPFEPAELLDLVARGRTLYSVADLAAVEPPELGHFTKEDAFDLGVIAGSLIRSRGLNLAVEIVIGDDLVFRAKFGATGVGNDEWLAGKAAVVRSFGESSLLVKLRHEQAGTPFGERADIDHAVMKAHGGSIPLRVSGVVVATITMSGEPDVVDHATCAEAVALYLEQRAERP